MASVLTHSSACGPGDRTERIGNPGNDDTEVYGFPAALSVLIADFITTANTAAMRSDRQRSKSLAPVTLSEIKNAPAGDGHLTSVAEGQTWPTLLS